MSVRTGLDARNMQAARDALRRRQKEKKARIVKRHVHYKEKKRLLEELATKDTAAPIVAPELMRPGEGDDDNEMTEKKHKKSKNKKKGKNVTPTENEDIEAIEETATLNTSDDIGKETDEVSAVPSVGGSADEERKGSKAKKYAPYTKERKQFEKLQKEREVQKQEREKKINERVNMLKKSKKERKKRVSLFIYHPRKKACRSQNNITHTLRKKERVDFHKCYGYCRNIFFTHTASELTLLLLSARIGDVFFQAKQYRKVTRSGQPRLKHRLDAIISRIQKE